MLTLHDTNQAWGFMAKLIANDGTELDATFTVSREGDGFAIFFESAGGRKGTPAARNVDYTQGLYQLLVRLYRLQATIVSIALERAHNDLRPIDERRLELGSPYPIHLLAAGDLWKLRLAITKAASAVGRDAGSFERGGNPRKRIRISVTLPDGAPQTYESIVTSLVTAKGDTKEFDEPESPVTIGDVWRRFERFLDKTPAADLRNFFIIGDHWLYDATNGRFAPDWVVGGHRAVRSALSMNFVKNEDLVMALFAQMQVIFGPGYDTKVKKWRFIVLPPKSRSLVTVKAGRGRRNRQLRSFDPQLLPTHPRRVGGFADPVQVLALQEKAAVMHHAILVALHSHLSRREWSAIAEDPIGMDLVATAPAGGRVIFEAKSIEENEASQVRSAIGQLLEYRYFDGEANDLLCLAVNKNLTPSSVALLNHLGIVVVVVEVSTIRLLGELGEELFASTGDGVVSEHRGSRN